MAGNSATLSKNRANPEISIIIGFAQVGSYLFYLWDADRTNPTLVHSGDKGSDSFKLSGPLASFDQKYLTWQVLIGAPAPGTENYAVTVDIEQNNVNVPEGPYVQKGTFEDSELVYGWVQFKVV